MHCGSNGVKFEGDWPVEYIQSVCLFFLLYRVIVFRRQCNGVVIGGVRV